MPAPDRPFPALVFLAAELSDLPARVAAIEEVVGDLASRTDLAANAVMALQDLDLIRQTLEDLARLAAFSINPTDDDREVREATADVLRLHALRGRLLGVGACPDHASAGIDAFESFGTRDAGD